jgi:hypothetical protein
MILERPMNLRQIIPSFAVLLMIAAPAEAKHVNDVSGQPVTVDQTQPYTYTTLRETGNHTQVKTRDLKPQQYDHVSAQLDKRMNQMTQKALDGKGNAKTCAAPGANYATTDQSGSNDVSHVSQFGNVNSASVNQPGNNDRLYAFQSGTGLTAQTTQSGNHEITFVDQHCH